MKLFIRPHDQYVKEYYENIANTRSTEYSDDSGFDIIVPFDVTVPAKARGFKIKHLIILNFNKYFTYFIRTLLIFTLLGLYHSIAKT